MTGPKSSRRLLAAVALALLLVPTCIAAAKTESHKPKSKTQSHKPKCKAHYVARRVRVRKREHHRLVWVRQWKCVKAKGRHAPEAAHFNRDVLGCGARNGRRSGHARHRYRETALGRRGRARQTTRALTPVAIRRQTPPECRQEPS